jgi:VWFA-related protein
MCPRCAVRPTFLFCLLALAACGFAQATSAAQPAAQGTTQPAANASPAQEGQPAATLRVTTRLVVVDVVAADNKGAPVTDLKSDDFTVQEEGVEQPIQVFSFHQPGAEVPASAAGPFVSPASLPKGIYTNVPRYRTGGALNVLLLDALNSNLLNQAAMRDAMVQFMQKIPAGEPIAIYLLGNKLTLIQDFTSNPELLKKAIAGMKRQGSRGLSNPAGNTAMAQMPIGSVAADTISMMNGLQAKLDEFRNQQNAAQTDLRVRYTLDALNALARSLAGYPGRKNLVWISETFPVTIAINRVTSNNSRDYSSEVARTGSLLSNAQVAIYPVDARALAGSSQFSVGSDPNPMGVPEMAKQRIDGEAGTVVRAESDERIAARSTMNDLAEKTGGRAFYNTNNLESAVRKSMEDGSTYYTLGYYPANKTWDGKFRKITVKTVRPGIKLHYRQGYFAMEPQSYAKLETARKNDDLAQALSLDFPESTALRFQAAVAPPSAQTQNKVLVNYAVDPRQLTFDLESDGLQHANVDCAVIAYSKKGEAVQTLSNTMMAALKPDEYKRVMEKSFPCRQSFELAPGEYLLRLGVRDARTGLTGTLDAPLSIPAAGNDEQPSGKKP